VKVVASTLRKKAWKEKTRIMKNGFEELFRKSGVKDLPYLNAGFRTHHFLP
jgi:hypothetical protein